MEGRRCIFLFYGRGARAETAPTPARAPVYWCAKETVELRDWRVSDNRTAGAIRLTSRLPVLSLAKRSWNQVPELSAAAASRGAGRDDIECRTLAIRTKRKVNGINVSGQPK